MSNGQSGWRFLHSTTSVRMGTQATQVGSTPPHTSTAGPTPCPSAAAAPSCAGLKAAACCRITSMISYRSLSCSSGGSTATYDLDSTRCRVEQGTGEGSVCQGKDERTTPFGVSEGKLQTTGKPALTPYRKRGNLTKGEWVGAVHWVMRTVSTRGMK